MLNMYTFDYINFCRLPFPIGGDEKVRFFPKQRNAEIKNIK
jgi:hypothetical protein